MLNNLCDSLDKDVYTRITRSSSRNQIALDELTYNYIVFQGSKMNMHKTIKIMDVILKQISVTIISILYRNSSDQNAYPEWFSNFLNSVRKEENIAKNINEIYKLTHYSQPMISYYSKKYLGETLVSYFTKLKLNYACNLLQNTNFTIEYIASCVGYNSLSHFFRIFKQYTNKSPTEFRKS